MFMKTSRNAALSAAVGRAIAASRIDYAVQLRLDELVRQHDHLTLYLEHERTACTGFLGLGARALGCCQVSWRRAVHWRRDQIIEDPR